MKSKHLYEKDSSTTPLETSPYGSLRVRDDNGATMEDKIIQLKNAIENADAVLIGAGAGLSTAAGFTYSGERFEKYFSDFARKYGFRDMYSGGFYPYETLEEHWAYWSRYIFINRYMASPTNLYGDLLELVKDKNYFVLTTNVDHQFQKAGFDKSRLFYTQGDYGLFQCSVPCHNKTYDNEEIIRKMITSQGWEIENALGDVGAAQPFRRNEAKAEPRNRRPSLATVTPKIPTELIPRCPVCGKPMSMNLRADDTFVQDEGWYEAAKRYEKFISQLSIFNSPLFLELGVGYNTPGIIKYPFWRMTQENKNATYVCINKGEAVCPKEIEKRSICIDGDIDEVVNLLLDRERD